jgi:MFS family permease
VQLRFAMMFSVTSLAGAFSGLLAFAILHLNGEHGIAGWRWIFILVRILFYVCRILLIPCSSLRREPSPSLLGLPLAFSSPPHLETSNFSPKRSAKYIAGTLPKIGVVMLTPMANIRRCSVGVKLPAYSRMRPIFCCSRFPSSSTA